MLPATLPCAVISPFSLPPPPPFPKISLDPMIFCWIFKGHRFYRQFWLWLRLHIPASWWNWYVRYLQRQWGCVCWLHCQGLSGGSVLVIASIVGRVASLIASLIITTFLARPVVLGLWMWYTSSGPTALLEIITGWRGRKAILHLASNASPTAIDWSLEFLVLCSELRMTKKPWSWIITLTALPVQG